MAVQLKPLSEQVMLITGASSGIGRVTAKHAAAAGAKVVLVARNEEALKQVVDEITADGGQAVYAIADVADIDQIKAAADTATTAFGRIDTWVNNAGVGLFTDITKNTEQDDRKIFETNFWGIVNGSRVAAQYLRDQGGALINLGSEVSDITTPTQGMYAASKHAIMGFTDAFRMEVIKSELPISVTLIKPAAIDTPFAKHAQNNTQKNATLPAPVYAPELVADQILHAAEHPVRDLYVGGGGRVMAMLAEHFPSISDWVIAKFMPSQELKDEPADHSNEALHDVGGGAYEERGGLKGERMVREHSLYGVVSRHPYAVTFGVAAASAAVAYLLLRPETPEPPTRTQKFKNAVREHASGPIAQARAAIAQALAEAKEHADGPLSKVRNTVADYAQEARDAVRGYASNAKAAATDYADTARERVGDAADSARGYASDVREYAGSSAERARAAAKQTSGTARDYADSAKDGLHAAADRYVANPADALVAAVRRGIDKFLS